MTAGSTARGPTSRARRCRREHPFFSRCGPEGLLRQTRGGGSVRRQGGGENALCRRRPGRVRRRQVQPTAAAKGTTPSCGARARSFRRWRPSPSCGSARSSSRTTTSASVRALRGAHGERNRVDLFEVGDVVQAEAVARVAAEPAGGSASGRRSAGRDHLVVAPLGVDGVARRAEDDARRTRISVMWVVVVDAPRSSSPRADGVVVGKEDDGPDGRGERGKRGQMIQAEGRDRVVLVGKFKREGRPRVHGSSGLDARKSMNSINPRQERRFYVQSQRRVFAARSAASSSRLEALRSRYCSRALCRYRQEEERKMSGE